MKRINQEFFCTRSGGGCGKFFIIPLNPNLNRIVEIVCPSCDHHHQRLIKDGKVLEIGRYTDKPKEQIYAQISTLSDEPITHKFLNKVGSERDGAVIKDTPERHEWCDAIIKERWFEIFGGRRQ